MGLADKLIDTGPESRHAPVVTKANPQFVVARADAINVWDLAMAIYWATKRTWLRSTKSVRRDERFLLT